MGITKNERQHYVNAKNETPRRSKFDTPEEEYEWSQTQKKPCSKCKEDICLNNFAFNCSGNDHFNKSGYRHRRPECKNCLKKEQKTVENAKNKSKEAGEPTKAPEGSICEICKSDMRKLVYDHDHKKEVFRGWLCDPCNRGLGMLGDNVDGMMVAMNYILIREKRIIIQNDDGTLSAY